MNTKRAPKFTVPKFTRLLMKLVKQQAEFIRFLEAEHMKDEQPPTISHDFGDPETLLNSRDWLQKTLEDKGAEIVAAGVGGGQADLTIMLDGYEFNVSIRPIIRNTDARTAGEENSA